MLASTLLDTPPSAIADTMSAQGFAEGPPLSAREGHKIDVRIARRRVCPECGKRGLNLLAFHKPGRYKAFASCPKCNHAYEV